MDDVRCADGHLARAARRCVCPPPVLEAATVVLRPWTGADVAAVVDGEVTGWPLALGV